MQIGSTQPSQHDVLQQLLEENKTLNKQILASSKKIEKYILWLKVLNILKFVIIIIPLLLGFWFVSPYLRQFQSSFSAYRDLLGITKPTTQPTNSTSSNDTFDQLDSLMNSEQIQELLNQQLK